jgi:smad nuclear-interacting protein 1
LAPGHTSLFTKSNLAPIRIKTEQDGAETEVDKEAPNFEVSGKLLEDTNTFNGVVVKYSEPPGRSKPFF